MVLDDNQRAAVETTSSNVLVAACAGSGKTRVLTERIRYLIDNGENPSNIVAITLTNQAADEMLSRLDGVPGINAMFVGTIHSLAYQILRALGYNFKILTDDVDYQLHLEIINKYAKSLTVKEYDKYRTMYLSYKLGIISENRLLDSLSYDSLQELNWMDEEPTDKHPVTVKSLCKSRNIIEFDDLLRFVNSSGVKLYINHLLVDEFQDIGPLEYKFIKKLGASNLFYVGDDWQSIYGFKGSNLEVFRDLYNNDKFTKYVLSNNYRSCHNIVDLGNRIIGYDYKHIDKPVTSTIEDNGIIKYVGEEVLLDILHDIDEQDYHDWFVLTRSNKDLVYLQNVLQMEGIPTSIFRREGMSKDDITALMNLNTVKLMTIHAAKGLESDNVLLYGNYSRVLDNIRDAEEIRIYYVAVTRARKNLIIMRKNNYKKNLDVSNFVSTKIDKMISTSNIYHLP